jgi:hypothetical protein
MRMKDENEPPKIIDLHPSEWKSEESRQPFFGPAAPMFFKLFLLGFPISTVAHLIVTGEIPYYLRRLLE